MRRITTATTLVAILWAFQSIAAQTDKERGSITGQVKVDGKPAKDITVIANPSIGDPSKLVESMLNKSASLKATTDSDGRYKFEDVPAGKYRLVPFAPLLVSASIEYGSEVTVTADSKTEGIDFSLLPGGVVTGKVSDSEGRPVIGEKISLKPVKDPIQPDVRAQGAAAASIDSMMSGVFGGGRMYTTDDRGIYRMFGLRPGRYLVSAGGYSDVFSTVFKLRQKRVKTFYPGVTEEAQARQVEVRAGSESTGIDIQLSVADKGFAVSGRVIDAEKGTPIANVMVGYSKASSAPPRKMDHVQDESNTEEFISGAPGEMGFGMSTTNDRGEFRFESVAAGKYQLEVTQIGAMIGQGTSEFYGDPLSFEVRGANVDRLEVKMHRGASISGVVVLEEEAQNGPQTLAGISVTASAMDSQTNSHSIAAGVVGEDGTFKIGGLKAGKVMIQPFSMSDKNFVRARIERNGIELQGGIDIQANEQITGVRVVLTSGNCVIRGHVTIQGGSLPSGGRLTVVARRLLGGAVDPSDTQSGEVDAKGDFVIEDLAPATYEVEAFVFMPAREGMRSASAKQTVTTSKNGPTNVELVLDVSRTDK